MCTAKGWRGRAQSPPPRSRRSEIPAFRKRAAMSERPATRSRPFGATMCRRLVERLGWRVCGRAKLLAGTLRCLRLLLTSSFELSAQPTVGALPQPPQGTLSLDPARGRRKGTKSPLDPFARLSWSHSHNSSACCSPILLPPLPQVPATSPANPHSPSQSAHSGRAASSLPPPAIHTASAPRRRAGRCWSRSFHPADDRR